ncbi:ParB/Srx family N-terminal domain-containing protein [Arthrobacter sp. Leaf141]|uniref:ParB/Srx family N-terminal domain-containing protein n=1 Tax=Arthrobacter sp. Leaf141 TaxID=1736273 RepID=UPI0012F9C008|nr:ParB/Srx family N-terminal domain-containing protein [Arthrobacter sp. Leaf141]
MSGITFSSQWDEDASLHYISTQELGLPQASVLDDTEATALLTKWHRGWLALGAPENVPLSSLNASIQGVLRKDVLDFYLTQPQGTFEDQPSSWGAQGPLAVELSDGRTVLVDGNHRWAAAKIRLEPSFLVQILRGKASS